LINETSELSKESCGKTIATACLYIVGSFYVLLEITHQLRIRLKYII